MAKHEGDSSGAAVVKKRARRQPAKGRVWSKLLKLFAESFPKLFALLKLIFDWTQRKSLWIRVPLYLLLVLAACLYGFRDSLLKLPVVDNVKRGIEEYAEDIFAPPLPKFDGKGFGIAAARIEGDDDNRVRELLTLSLKIQGVQRLQIDRRLRVMNAALPDAAEAAAHATARRWLEKSQADIVIWGHMIRTTEPGVRLIMTPRHARPGRDAQLVKRDLAFSFPDTARESFEPAMQAQVLGYLAQFDSSHVVVEQLRQAVARLAQVVQSWPEGKARAAVVFALANAKAILGEQAGDRAMLAEAVATYQELIHPRVREQTPLDWAMYQNSLGSTLWSLGRLESGHATLEQAVNAYRAALEEYLPEKSALEWAMIQNNLGNALVTVGERRGEAAPLQEAVAAFQAALKVRTRQKGPLNWAMTQSNLGNALGILGERESGTARLEEAVSAYREALKEYTLERLPLDWAMTQNNLGTALATWGEREQGTARLQEAVAVLRAALEQRPREKVPLNWAMTQDNLGQALRIWGEREAGTARLQEAVTAFRAALAEYTREKVPLNWAMTQNSLADALRILGEREKNPQRIEEAIRMFEAVLDLPELKSAPHYRTIFQNNLWKASAAKAALAPATR